MNKVLLFLLSFSSYTFAQDTIILCQQPGPTEGKDASLGYHDGYGTDNNNYGTDYLFKAFSVDGSGSLNENRGLIQFDLSIIPKGTTIISAELSLYASGYVNSALQGHSGDNAAVLSRITSPWSESSVTWNTAPATTSENQVITAPSLSSDQDYIMDVKNIIQDMINDPLNSYGFHWMLQNETPNRILSFYSSDASEAAKRPKLCVTYETAVTSLESFGSQSFYCDAFPNPFNETLTFKTSISENSDLEISLYNGLGELIYKDIIKKQSSIGTVTNTKIKLSDLNLPHGIYFCEVKSGSQSFSKKLIKL